MSMLLPKDAQEKILEILTGCYVVDEHEKDLKDLVHTIENLPTTNDRARTIEVLVYRTLVSALLLADKLGINHRELVNRVYKNEGL